MTTIARQIAEAASIFQHQRTGHAPQAVTVVMGEDTIVITLHQALSPAERALARSHQGAAQIQEFHRQLFASSSEELRREIMRITGRVIQEAAAEIDPATGAIVHAFTSGTMVQVFNLAKRLPTDSESPAHVVPNVGPAAGPKSSTTVAAPTATVTNHLTKETPL